MDQTSVLLKLNYLMGLANASSAAGRSGRLGGPEAMSAADWPANMTLSPFNFSADTAAGLIEDYLANMFTVSQPATIALLCLYAPVFLFSLAGNSFVIVMFVKDRRMRRVKSLFLVNLALVRSLEPRQTPYSGTDLVGSPSSTRAELTLLYVGVVGLLSHLQPRPCLISLSTTVQPLSERHC